jgi:ubiquinone biosynthesis protein COQ4
MRSPLQSARLIASVTRLTLDLRRLDAVIDINDTLMKLRTEADTRRVIEEFRRSPTAADALQSRHRLGPLDPSELAAMPADSLGGAYGRFMQSRGLKPESLPEVQGCSDIEYILAHTYETHDLWHVVTGFDTDVPGEVALQAFYLAQQRSYLPFFALSAVLLNTAFFAYDQKAVRLDAITEGWQRGRRAASLLGIDWRIHLDRPLEDVRRELSLERDDTRQEASGRS